MNNQKQLDKIISYNKHNSFFSFSSINDKIKESDIIKKINFLYNNKIGLESLNANQLEILKQVINDLNLKSKKKKEYFFNF